MKISVLTFDLADNAAGRAELLARLLAPRFDVDVVGPIFGGGTWGPLRSSAISHRGVGARRSPAFIGSVPALLRLIDGDLIYASKPRPTSFGLGLLARARRRRPLLLDVDDWELGFFYRGGRWGTVGRALNLADPNGLTWSWAAERLAGAADALTVGSRFLERRFGGTLIPHVRDTEAWDPARFDRGAARARLGVGDRPVVMFLGTPRGYKGVDDLVDAVGAVGGGALLVLVGADPASAAARRWAARPWVRVVGEIGFDEVPGYLVAADVVAVPQRATTDTVGQVPAKIFDAMALARPIVATAVSMIPEILDGCGLIVSPSDVAALAAAIRMLLGNHELAEAFGRKARARCAADYSFTAARSRLYPLIDQLMLRARRGAR